MPKVYNGLQSSFVSLAWLWSVGHSSRGTVGVLGPWLEPNLVRLPVLLPPTIWPTQSLTVWYFITWLVDWPIAAGKLADCLSHKISTWPSPGRDILWSSVWLLWSHRPVVRCTPIATSHGPVWYYLRQAELWSDVPPPPWDFRLGWHLVRCQVRSTSCQMYPPTEKVICTWKDDWSPWMTSTPQKTFYLGG